VSKFCANANKTPKMITVSNINKFWIYQKGVIYYG
jgi:hypothetical protein